MDNNLALLTVKLVPRSELNFNATIESDSGFFWFGSTVILQ